MRILSGTFKGRKLLPPPRSAQTRPITGAVKKSLFGMLGPWLDGATVVDLYCGTGTMGLEALSRGAAWCGFADRDRAVVGRLRRNIETVGAVDRSAVWCGDLTRKLSGWLGRLPGPLDIALLDPPFASARRWDWPEMETKLIAPLAGVLAGDGVVVLRLPDGTEAPDELASLRRSRRRAYGGMSVSMYRRDAQDD